MAVDILNNIQCRIHFYGGYNNFYKNKITTLAKEK